MMIERTGVEWRAAVHAALGEPARLAITDRLLLGDASPGELGAALDVPSNLLAHHLRVLAEAGVITRLRSEADRRRTYVRLAPETLAALAPAAWIRVVAPPRVVFVCTRNSARSQLAAALWAQRSRVPAASAGTHPGPRVHRRAMAVARRHGLALHEYGTQDVHDVVDTDDLIVAVCDNAYEELKPRPGLHWSVPDPVAVNTDTAFENAFAEIAARVDRLTMAVSSGAGDPTESRPPSL